MEDLTLRNRTFLLLKGSKPNSYAISFNIDDGIGLAKPRSMDEVFRIVGTLIDELQSIRGKLFEEALAVNKAQPQPLQPNKPMTEDEFKEIRDKFAAAATKIPAAPTKQIDIREINEEDESYRGIGRIEQIREWLRMHGDYDVVIDLWALYGCYEVKLLLRGKVIDSDLGRTLTRRLAWALERIEREDSNNV